MKKLLRPVSTALFMVLTLLLTFFVNLFLLKFFDAQRLVPMLFVLSVFFISLRTPGYLCGIIASFMSVLAVNYAFTFPYYAFDLITPENLASAVIMLAVAFMTSALTTKLATQEKVKAEAEKERMRANLLRAVSHDLRTPLTSISGACSAILENYDFMEKEKHMKLLGEVLEDAEWLTRMVENLLSVTRIDGKRVALQKTDTVLEELIDTVLVKFKKRYPDRNVALEIPDNFIIIPMDAVLIEQVLLNLLENAVLHAKGMTKLSLRVTLDGRRAVFDVMDDGCGLAPESLANLFTGYLDREIADSSKSMGIGLSVCASIIRAHEGEIYAENLKTGGAKFTFVLQTEEEYEQ